MVIGRAAASVWAKSAPYLPEVVEWWLPLHQHLDDARGVAERLVEEWLPRQVVERIALDLPGWVRRGPSRGGVVGRGARRGEGVAGVRGAGPGVVRPDGQGWVAD